MADSVIAPDSVGRVIEYLSGELGLLVANRLPHELPGEYVRVSRVGGGTFGRVTDRPMLMIEAWAGTGSRACEIVFQARSLLSRTGRHIPGLFVTRYAEVGGPVDLPDPDTNMPRWRFTVELQCRMIGVDYAGS